MRMARGAIRGTEAARRRRADLYLEGYDACLEAILEAMARRGARSGERVTLLQDCAELCQVAADFLLRRSPRAERVGRFCAAVCAEASAACRVADGRPWLRQCGEILGLIARERPAGEAVGGRRRARGSARPPGGTRRR